MSVVDGMCRILAAAGVGVYDPDAPIPKGSTPITVGDMPPTAGPAICVTTYAGGPEPDSRTRDEYPRLQVRVRDTNPLTALALDRACFNALQFTPTGTRPQALFDGEWLQDCHALQSEAQPLGVDSNGRHEFTRNYQLTVEPV